MKKCCRRITLKSCRCWSFGLGVAFLIGICIFAVCLCLLPCGCRLHIEIEDCLQILILAITAIIALSVYKSSQEIEEVNTLIKLRELLTTGTNHEIHKKLEEQYLLKNKGNGKTFKENGDVMNDTEIFGFHKCDMFNYLGSLELCKIILDHKILSEESFMNQFGYRTRNVAGNKELLTYIGLNDCRFENNTYWSDLKNLIDTCNTYYKQN